HLGEPADTAALRGRKRHAKTDKTDARHLRTLLGEGRLPECWIPPGHILEYRALLETYHDLRAEHTAWVQPIHAVFFCHAAAPRRGGAARGPGAGGGAGGAPRAARLSRGGGRGRAAGGETAPGGGAGGGPSPRPRRAAARHLVGAKVLAARLYGAGPITALA